ncbi:host specificity protein J [Escherichia coli]|nr:host specificity protein J [Escherichia coli]
MGKGSSKGHTPREAKDNLKSTQLLSVIDAISEGPVEGPVDGLKSVLLNSTPVLDTEGNTNISGVTVVFRAGEQEQTPPEGFESSGSETVLGTEVKYDTPITRTITSANIDRLRFTFGVQALVETTSKGDRNPSEVRLLVQIQRNGGWVTEKDITIKGKTTSQYLASVVVGNLPPRPFNIRMRRMTPDSTTDQLQNKTLWSSYTEIIDVKQCYPNTALVGVQVDSEQFGSQQVSRNYHLRGRILQVPSNYNPQTRQYSGIWDGTFKPAYSNNMAWCLWDMLTHPRYGMGKRLGAADVDKWALYVIGQCCDQSVPDGTDQLQNKTLWSSYTEIIDVKQCYPNTALVGVQVDSEQFGSQQVSRNYHLRGRILQVPSNYNPQTRQYSGIWDGTFKPAYSNNPAWCLWDMLTHPRYGMGKRLGAVDVDKWALYLIGQYCDQSVPDGFGGTEPRITCNAWLTTQRKAWDVLSDFCSAMRCMPVWNGQTLTFVQDRPSDKVWTYNRSNVVMPDDGAPFRYSFSALKDRHNAVEVNWIDPDNGWETATELVEDTQAILRYGRNVTKMDAFGCTSRGQAHRAGLWLIKTELLETQTVDFSVGAEGLRHVPGDVIEICDDDYAGISTGGRVLAVNSQTRTLTLDREITLPSSGTTLISLVDGSGNPVSVEVQSVTDGVKVKVSRVPDGVAGYSVIDPDNGWETATELVEDTQAIARYGRNVTKMDAFGCTSRGQAHRAGLWLIKTELLETQTVDFSVGAEGLRHVPGDVIEICDDDYAGISMLAVNSQTRTLTLDREITLPSSGTTLISLVDGQGSPVSVEVQSVTDGVKVKVSRVPDGVAGYSVWGLKLPTLRQRLFRCVSIRENDDGTYAITAVQHVPEKEAIVDNGAHFDGDQSGTVNGVTPPAVQHLTAEVTADSGEYQVLARWDTPKVVKGVSFLLRLTVTADDGSERLVSTARTTETTYRFRQLALGNYRLTVRAVNAWGQQGDPASVSFRIAAPAAPSRIELTPGYFQITATPHLAVYDPTVQFEFWFSEKRITDIRKVETTARYLGTALYWIAASINIKPGHDYYFYVRSVNTVGKSAFVEAVGQPSDDASGYLDFFKGEIGKTHLAQELWTQIDNGQLAPDLTEIRTSITDVSNEITQTVNKKLEDQSAAIQQIQKVQVDTNNNLNSMWAVKLQQMQDGRLYIAGIGAGIENTPDGMQSQVLLAADRIAMINPANGNTKPMFVGQGDQIFMNEVFLKRLTAPTITSGGNPPAFSLTSDGRLTAKNADISGSVNANSGTLNNVTINQNCTIKGMLEATQVRGDFVKAVSKAFPKKVGTWGNTETPNGTVTVTISDDHNFDRQIIIPPIIFNGIAYDDPGSGNNPGGTRYTGYGFEVRKNGVLIASRETKGAIPGSYSAVIDMPSGRGSVTLEFKIFQKGNQGAGNITDCTVIVTKKAASGISIR